MASSTAACSLSLVTCIAEFEDGSKLGDSTSSGSATGIGVTNGGVTKSGVTEGVEICDGATTEVGCCDSVVVACDVPIITKLITTTKIKREYLLPDQRENIFSDV